MPLTDADLLNIRDWLRAHGMPCPSCSGASSVYSTWIVVGQEVVCDSCYWPSRIRTAEYIIETTPEETLDERDREELKDELALLQTQMQRSGRE